MHATARDAYLEAQVLTATPHKLRLLLIEGALRFARQSLKCWDDHRDAEALQALVRCRAIVSELLTSIRTEESPVARKVAAVYVFLFRELAEAQLQRDPSRLPGAIEVLETERETWRQVCDRMPQAPGAPDGSRERSQIASSQPRFEGPPTSPTGDAPAARFVLEA